MFAQTFIAITSLSMLFIGLPWLVLHYVTRWKTAATLTGEDEALLDQLYETARRLEERLTTIERIVAADDPHYRAGLPPLARPPADDRRPDFDHNPLDRRN